MNKTENLGLNKPTMKDLVTESVEKTFGENFDIIDEKISDIDEDISELSENLNDKADKEHSHSQYATAADLESGLAGKADSSHTHSAYAPKASPTFTGTPKAPTASKGTNTTQVATTAFVQDAINDIVIPEDTSELAHSHANKTVLDAITASKTDEWDAKVQYGEEITHLNSDSAPLNSVGSGIRIIGRDVSNSPDVEGGVLFEFPVESQYAAKSADRRTAQMFIPHNGDIIYKRYCTSKQYPNGADTWSDWVAVGGGVTYSNTPQQIGTWLDGMPVWRAAFKAPITDTMKIDKACSIFYDLSFVKSAERVKLVIGGFACIDNGSVIDNNTTTLDGFGRFNWDSINPIAEYISGYIDFVTEAENIKS